MTAAMILYTHISGIPCPADVNITDPYPRRRIVQEVCDV